MNVHLAKSKIRGEVRAPASKSYTIRGLMCAALSPGESQIAYPLSADDTEAASRVLSQIGVVIERGNDLWRVHGGQLHPAQGDLFCADSAATLRFMTAVCSLVPGRSRLTAGASLEKRPIAVLIDALRQLGVKCSSHGDAPPVTVEGGRLRGSTTELPGDISSQYVSALLLIAPFAEDGMTIKLTTPLESAPYVDMTLECLRQFGIVVKSSPECMNFEVARQSYQPARYVVEGDWSSASYLLALGALAGEVKVRSLNRHSLQGDKTVLDWLTQMGVRVEWDKDAVIVSKSPLKAVRADLSECIDLLPTMAVLASAAPGTSTFTGISRARLKESNRVAAVKEGLEGLGIEVGEGEDSLTVTGGKPGSAIIDSKGDHRIAMAFGVLGAAVGDMAITGAECVSKTYPEFWEVLQSLGGRFKIDG